MKIIIKWLVCVGALALAAFLFPAGVRFTGGFVTLVAAGTVLWLANLFVRPLLQLISLPITLRTLGLFSLIVNAGIVALTDTLISAMKISNFWLCLFIALIVSAGNAIFASNAAKHNYKQKC